ncbi:MAG: MotA/TolQ/ExbB proton channel family protein [Bacillota bacterium]|nr:MotA/TolQ/ExbB proton channel family protein [Bacillota bacterium]MDW7677784.1 MotA/TolQ/ExbB proton channel family protein [Bacillota bacterium]
MIRIILRNLLGYDVLILLLAVFNAVVIYPRTKSYSLLLKNQLQPKIYVPVALLMERVKGKREDKLNLNALIGMRSDEIQYYSIFSAINSAFPMMGMLGTILSLLNMVETAQQQVTLNFTIALTSTLWGLIFALAFKAVDATLYPMVEQNRENLKMLLERVDLYSDRGMYHEPE